MNIIDFLFSTDHWPPRWYCGSWTDALGWVHIVSDLAIFGAYVTIPFILLYFCWKKRDIPFQKILILFGLFIVFCGTGHLIESIIFWFPIYRFDGLIKASTALVSWMTVFALIPYIPRVLNFPKIEQLNEVLESDLKGTRERLELAFEGSGAGLWDLNIATNEMSVSNRFANFIGFQKKEIIPVFSEYVSRLHPDEKEFVLNELQKHLKGRTPFNLEHRLRHRTGNYLWFNSVGQAQWDESGNAIRMVGSITNIDEKIESKNTLINSNNLLKEEIERRKVVEKQLEAVIENLKNANIELDQLANIASHDLQEPLRTISNFVKLFEKRNLGKLDEETKIYMNFIVTATARMKNLIEDLLEFARVGDNSSFETVDCHKVFQEVLDDLALSIKENKIEITVAPLPKVIGKKIRLKRLFQNLINNAIKFRKTDIQTKIDVTVEEKEDKYIFTVKDNGIGIESEYLPKLFIIFQRLHKTDEYPGTGIGLAICKKIVTLHQGKIWVDSKVGEGSAFHFSLPKKEI